MRLDKEEKQFSSEVELHEGIRATLVCRFVLFREFLLFEAFVVSEGNVSSSVLAGGVLRGRLRV